MRFLQVINWILLAASAVMALTLSVVCLMFWIYRHEPVMQASFPELVTQTAMFLGLTLVTAASALTLHHRKTGYWILQLGMFLAVGSTVNYYIPD
ncbi:MAG: hypothetical protein R3352_07270 [Salinisphaeraceae bacterium]|nr:hypothetical protein [Salinisphaeraceae bacterium]